MAAPSGRVFGPFWSENGYTLCPFALESGMVFEGTTECINYTCQLSRLRVENFDLTPAHACGPISQALLKNVSCCRLA